MSTNALHAAIMNIQADHEKSTEEYRDRREAYIHGHRDARHAAAELVAAAPAADAVAEALQEYLEAQDYLDNHGVNGINAEPFEVLMRRRNAARRDLDAALAAQPQQATLPASEQAAPEIDVRRIPLDVTPGIDGMGHEVYATSVADVEARLGDLGERLEEWELGIRRLPAAIARDQPQADAAEPEIDEDEEGAAECWRRLALQFDEHRMVALFHIRALLADPMKHSKPAAEFLAAPPLSGIQVLADRIAALAAHAQPAPQALGADAEELAALLGKYKKLCILAGRGDGAHLDRIDQAIASLAAATTGGQS